jgi:hypothetical protein
LFHHRRRVSSILAFAVVAALVVPVLGGAVARSSPVPGAAAPAPAALPRPPDTYVAAWDAVGTQAFTAAGLTPAEGHTIFAYVAIAVYDSVMAVQQDYEPFAVDLDAPAGSSAEAAVAAAAHAILVHYLPAQEAAIIGPAYTASLAAMPADQATADGISIGEQVASAVIALRADDGFRAAITYTAPNPPVPGAWLPTAGTPPIGPYLGQMRPFVLDSADQFRPDGPPALASKKWARDYREVKEIGSSTSSTRSAAQTLAARFWAEPPVQQARGSFRRFVLDHELDVIDAARFMAMISVTFADGVIACFDAKYHFAFWRPVTAIRAGATDGNDETPGDGTWSPLLGTPNHPEYPSGHSCVTPSAGIVIARFLDTDQIDFTIPSLTGLGDRHFATVKELQDEVTNARIWGGIHFRTAVEDGSTIARKTANLVLAHSFRAVEN